MKKQLLEQSDFCQRSHKYGSHKYMLVLTLVTE